jgi:hypothetical protein
MGGSIFKILIVKMFVRLQTHTCTCYVSDFHFVLIAKVRLWHGMSAVAFKEDLRVLGSYVQMK